MEQVQDVVDNLEAEMVSNQQLIQSCNPRYTVHSCMSPLFLPRPSLSIQILLHVSDSTHNNCQKSFCLSVCLGSFPWRWCERKKMRLKKREERVRQIKRDGSTEETSGRLYTCKNAKSCVRSSHLCFVFPCSSVSFVLACSRLFPSFHFFQAHKVQGR